MTWPYPGDGPNARARRVAQAYRNGLELADPAACYVLDGQMRAWGQHWIVPGLMTIDLEKWLTPAEAAELACIELDSVRQLRRRGRIAGRLVGGKWEYQTKEIVSLFTGPRGRNGNVTDTLSGSGSSVPKGGHHG